MLHRVERHIVINNPNIEQLCLHAANLYNYANYILRQSYFIHKTLPAKYDITFELGITCQRDYRALPAQTSQQLIDLLFKNWKAYFAVNKAYKQNPKAFTGPPKIPKYKKGKRKASIVIFTNQQCKLREGYIVFPKSVNLEPIKTSVPNLVQVRIVPQATCFVVEIVYNKPVIQTEINEDNALFIDLGVNNLATCLNNMGEQPFIINGKSLKSINQYYNKRKAKLQKHIGAKGTSNRISKLTHRRNCKVNDYMHKTSKYIVDYAVANKIAEIVIGHNDGWKQNIDLGKKTNQKFVNIPFNKLISQISYKAEDVGIAVTITEEAYTSKIDHLSNEPMCHQTNYLGKRVHRGLFKSATDRLINADINGCIGICRKVFENAWFTKLFDRGVALTPVRVNII